ncbi:MAG: hypothetical protein KBONHNOK_00542 [Candidatus Methanoperedenaceae archaeon GB50]|nr:MAG: hypothetical protein KBONHNOK_00542 [Candidatus Methanoperedenaceae archaeon GB50]
MVESVVPLLRCKGLVKKPAVAGLYHIQKLWLNLVSSIGSIDIHGNLDALWSLQAIFFLMVQGHSLSLQLLCSHTPLDVL